MKTIHTSIPQLIELGMNSELHWYPDDVTASRMAATLAAMANTRGGTVLVGVSPRGGRIQGVRDPEAVIDRIFQAALLTDPPLVLPFPRTEIVEGQSVLCVTVPAGLPHVYSQEGRFLGRSGKRETPLPARELRALLVERGVIQFESRVPSAATLEDLDFEQVAAYLEALGLSPETDAHPVLQRRGCLVLSDGELRPTYAALLLFGKYPQQWLPSASVLAARFPGTAFSDEFVKQEIRGTLPEQLRQTETFVRDHLRAVARLVGLRGVNDPETV